MIAYSSLVWREEAKNPIYHKTAREHVKIQNTEKPTPFVEVV